jgi:hypothetical protein
MRKTKTAQKGRKSAAKNAKQRKGEKRLALIAAFV